MYEVACHIADHTGISTAEALEMVKQDPLEFERSVAVEIPGASDILRMPMRRNKPINGYIAINGEPLTLEHTFETQLVDSEKQQTLMQQIMGKFIEQNPGIQKIIKEKKDDYFGTEE